MTEEPVAGASVTEAPVLEVRGTDVPDRLARARVARRELAGRGIHLAGIRHHSPQCAHAVARLIERVRPAVVLIEGPDDLDPLIGHLADPATVPPVALLTLRRDGEGSVSALYPLAEFSPEWVAVREAARLGVPTHFIDLPWGTREGEDPGAVDDLPPSGGETPRERAAPSGGAGGDDADDDTALLRRTLQTERYFAHSRTLAGLAERLHCRDHDELWDHLFEIRPVVDTGSAERLLEEVFVWAALSRLEYEDEVLLAEGSLPREHRMLGHVEEWRARVDGPIVVVTGAFHTLALVEALAGAPEGAPVRDHRARTARGGRQAASSSTNAADPEPGWVIRYTLDQLDGLRGYGAGMPSPGFYQRWWDAADPAGVTRSVLQDVVSEHNAAGQGDRISTASLTQAVLQAERLAQLREHAWPGRTDLLDAVLSTLAQGEVPPSLRAALDRALGGRTLGQLPPGVPLPPLAASARARAEKLRFVITDTMPRSTSLDIYRSASARARSRYLALMGFVSSGFAHLVSGPHYASGQDVHLLREVWEYAWTPQVETALIALVEWGTSLEEVATSLLGRRIDALVAAEETPAPRELAGLVISAGQMGLATLIPALVHHLRTALEASADLGAVADSGAMLLRAWNAREHLDLGDSADRLLQLIDDALREAGHRVALLGQCAAGEAEQSAIEAIVALRRLVIDRGQAGGDEGDGGASARIAPTFQRLREDVEAAPGVRGALLALAVTDGEVPDGELTHALRLAFTTGADPQAGVRLLEGVMTVAPELVVRDGGLLSALDARVGALEHDDFMAFLPDLRRSFARLRPVDTDRLARHVAVATGVRASDLVARTDITEADLGLGLRVDAEVRASLVDDALLAWAGGAG